MRRITLTNRELETLQHIVDGKTDQEIASLMGVSYGTVRWFVKMVLQKTYTRNRTEVATMYSKGKLDKFISADVSVRR